MKKLFALALAATFATVVFADDKKPAEPTCKMECCKKSGKSRASCRGQRTPQKEQKMASTDISASPDPELQQLESAKWHPSSLGSAGKLLALFSDDFVSVEYGTELNAGVARHLRAKALMSEGGAAQLIAMLDSTTFELSEWHSIPLGLDSVLLSYKVEAPQFGWRAYATSVWRREASGWHTVFYQASRAR